MEGIVCSRCMSPNDPGEKLCIKCGAPLGDFASTVSWEYGRAWGAAYHEPTSPRKKPIILVAVWILFGPSVVFGALFSIDMVRDVLARRPITINGWEITVMTVPLLYFLVGGWVLWVVTRAFLRRETTPPAR